MEGVLRDHLVDGEALAVEGGEDLDDLGDHGDVDHHRPGVGAAVEADVAQVEQPERGRPDGAAGVPGVGDRGGGDRRLRPGEGRQRSPRHGAGGPGRRADPRRRARREGLAERAEHDGGGHSRGGERSEAADRPAPAPGRHAPFFGAITAVVS